MSKKAEELCAGVKILHDEIVQLAEQVLFMAEKLTETQKAIKDEPLVIEYDNGGGQSGIRENPHYVAYEHLQTAFNKSLRQLADIIGKGTPNAKSSDVLAKLSVVAGKKAG